MIYFSLWKGNMCVIDGEYVATMGPCIRRLNRQPMFIIKQVAAQHNLSSADLTGPSRFAHVVKARQEAMYRIRKETKLSTTQIGKVIGGRDHATVLWGVKAHARRLEAI